MKKISLSLIVLIIGLNACRAQKGLNYANTKTGVGQIAEDINKAKNNALVIRLKATLADCQAIMKTKADAQKLYEYSESLHKKYANEKMIKAKDGQTDVLVSVLILGNESKSEKDRFARGYIQILDKFTRGIRIYTFRYVRPGSSSGMRYDGLTYVNNKWVFIPKMWRAFW
ncbi:hypothetical protein [Microscilla marina]|uniref:Uncharacterized protein n=1 Tax=Microscilla marina ATCC 23134 TaxID=313606 RepID=A1ZIC3_MICM2|nr:hypothetical protein [Microscilla marina]EAY29791.1 hypothetical protein M23134_05663 [Microscilla marina ATCC 23134]